MTIIIIFLILALLYCGGSWLIYFVQMLRGRLVATAEVELHTFHLGLCFILAAGFLGLIVGG